MRLELFTPDLSGRHEITHAISIQFEEKYNAIAKCALVLPMDDYNSIIAKEQSLLYVVEKNLSFEIVEVLSDTNANEITMNGYSLNHRLEHRVFALKADIVNVEADVYAGIQANLRDLGVLLSTSKGLTETVETTTLYGESLLSAVMPVLDSVQLGQRAVFDIKTKSVTWEIYKGNDLTTGIHRVVFSEEQGTAQGLVIDRDSSIFKNVCYCTAQYADGTEFVVTVGTATEENRREMWLSYSGDAQTEGESNAAFLQRVQQYAVLQLGQYHKRIGFTVDAQASELGTAYNIGDLVSCVSLRSGVRFDARITGSMYAQDINGYETKLTLGDPTLTVLEV